MLRILKPGILSTLQDLGRFGARAYGVPVSGAMDAVAHRIANFAVGNPANAASLEIGGGHFAAWTEDTGVMALFGAGALCWVDQVPLPLGCPFTVAAGSLLEVRPHVLGNYSYLAVCGGWSAQEVLNSRSTCLVAGFGGFEGRALRKGDLLKTPVDTGAALSGLSANACVSIRASKGKWGISRNLLPILLGFHDASPAMQNQEKPLVIKVLRGPEWHWWSLTQQSAFMNTPFVVSAQRNRMGIRLQTSDSVSDGLAESLFAPAGATMLSTGVCMGTIQVPPSGQPIVLGADAQTTGGYPRIAQIAAIDWPKMVQAPAGQKILFQVLDLEAAEALLWEREKRLTRLSIGFKFTIKN